MKDYLHHTFSPADKELISVIDELPLWAAPFGMKLLEAIKLKKGIIALDVGCGLGFPLIEVAQRLGVSSKVIGIDPWKEAIECCEQKIKKYDIKNAQVIEGVAEQMPFENNYFDLIISNNGINNVEDMQKSLAECWRVSKPGAQFVFTMNLEETMIEFYNVLEEVLKAKELHNEIQKMKDQIHSKRKPVEEVKTLLINSGFKISGIHPDSFSINFLNGTTMFNHSLIKYWFLGGWKNILNDDDLEEVFDQIENKLNEKALEKGELQLTIPFVTVDSIKKQSDT
ncbi:MAG: class I SAM-dependent methyltransferase [Ignavibacteria bacterium]|nr:class I SAM-dependent methyltransferase [Ignavibacteria bacterium]